MDFYTYLHCRPDGTPFYVGKGHGKRSHAFSQRNFHHRNIVAKYGAANIRVFVFHCASELDAFADEAQQIAQLRREGFKLCNFTDGGEGCSGRIATEEQRRKISVSNSGKKRTPEMRERISRAKSNPSAETRAKLALIKGMTGKRHSLETKKKMSISAMGNKRGLGNKGGLGRKLSIEHRAKLVAAWALRKSLTAIQK